MKDKFREMLSHKIYSFDHNPRGFREFEEYCRRYKIKAYYHQTKKTPTRRNAKLLVDNGENVSYNNPCSERDWRWVDLSLPDGPYTFVIPTEFFERCLALGGLP